MKLLLNKLSWKKDYIYYVISFLILLIGLFPYLLAVFYTLPAADDFSFSNDVAAAGGHNLLGVFNMIKNFYMDWQGTYLAIALGGGIDPLRRGNAFGINFFLFWIILAVMLIIGIFIYQLCRPNYSYQKSVISIVISMFFLCFLNTRITKEMYFWFNGACVYTIPLLVGILGSICLLAAMQTNCQGKKRKICILIGSISGFLASGGSLQIVGYSCWIYLLFSGWSIYKKRNIKGMLIAFIAALAGACINVAAPGNYVRKSISYETISLFKGAYYTVIAVFNEIKYLFAQTYVPWLLLVIVLLAFVFLKPVKESLYHPVIVGGAVILSWLISTFPVCYGYGDSSLAERGYEALDMYIVIGFFLFTNSMVNHLKLKGISLSKETILITGILAIINIGYLQNQIPFSTMPSMQCLRQVFSGELKQYHDEWTEVLKTIENNEDTIVEVPISRWAYEADMVVMRPGMSENFEKWVNDGIATYYGKEKVRVVVQDDTGEN